MKTDLRLVPATGNRIRVNAAAGSAGAHVVGLTDATTASRRAATVASAWFVRLGGAHVLPRSTPDWTRVSPSVLEAELRAFAPGFAMLGVVLPRQPERRHMMIFGRSLGTLVVAKLDADRAAIEHEADVLRILERRPIPSLLTPRVLATGPLELGDVEAHAMVTAVVAHRSSPAFGEALPWLDRDLAERLDTIDRPPSTPEHWLPCHGDLAPWNLRRTPFGLALFDWEATGSAPPGFDRAHYQACNAALGRMPWPELSDELADHLRSLIGARPESELGPVDRAIRERVGRGTPVSHDTADGSAT